MKTNVIPIEIAKNTDEPANKTTATAPRKRKKLPFSLVPSGPAALWTFTKMIKGRRWKASLHTPDRALAEMWAWDKYHKIVAQQFDLVDKQANRAGFARLGEIGRAYLDNPLVIAKAHTRRRNWNDLCGLVRECIGCADAAGQSAEVLTKALAFRFFALRIKRAEVEHAGDMLAIESAKRSANQTFTNARCMFSQRAMDGYSELKLPASVREFAGATKLPAKRQPRPVKLDDDHVARVIAAAGELKAADPAVWVAFWLMIGGGFRNVEAAHARVGWFAREEWGWRVRLELRADFMPKGSEGEVILPLAVMDEIMSLPRPDDFIVPAGNPTARAKAIYRRLNGWLTVQGIEAEAGKRAYRLRKYFVEMVRRQMGAAAAQVAARHASARTTAGHYLSADRMERPIELPAAPTAGNEKPAP